MRQVFLVAALLSSGCGFEGVTGSGNMVTKEIPSEEFHRIDASGSFKVNVTLGDKASVVVTADDNVWSFMEVETRDGTLHLGMKPGSYQNVRLEATVVTPRLDGVVLSGASEGQLHGIDAKGGKLDINLSGASSADGDVQAGDLTMTLSGASKVKLGGAADVIDVDASGASHGELDLLASKAARVRASGASEIDVKATTKLDYVISGASHLKYGGGPMVVRAESSGASEARGVN